MSDKAKRPLADKLDLVNHIVTRMPIIEREATDLFRAARSEGLSEDEAVRRAVATMQRRHDEQRG